MKNKLKILTDWWWEILIYQFNNYIDNIEIERLNKWLLWKKSFDWGELKNSLKMRSFEKDIRFDILHYNNWLDPIICNIPKNKFTIYESHSIHFWLDLFNSLYVIESPIKRFLGFFIHYIYFILFYFKIKKFDLYFTSIPSALPYAKKIRKDAIWLPNAIDFKLFEKDYDLLKLDKNYINIFLPTSVRVLKNQRKAWEIIDKIFYKYSNIRLYIINHNWSNYNLIYDYLEKYRNNIVWLPMIDRESIWCYYKSDWNLVFWSLWHKDNYAMLNMIELESMACKAPIVAMDSFEIIKVKYNDIESLAFKIIEDKIFRNNYVNKNYEYVKNIHSLENVSNMYINTIKKSILFKLKTTYEPKNT